MTITRTLSTSSTRPLLRSFSDPSLSGDDITSGASTYGTASWLPAHRASQQSSETSNHHENGSQPQKRPEIDKHTLTKTFPVDKSRECAQKTDLAKTDAPENKTKRARDQTTELPPRVINSACIESAGNEPASVDTSRAENGLTNTVVTNRTELKDVVFRSSKSCHYIATHKAKRKRIQSENLDTLLEHTESTASGSVVHYCSTCSRVSSSSQRHRSLSENSDCVIAIEIETDTVSKDADDDSVSRSEHFELDPLPGACRCAIPAQEPSAGERTPLVKKQPIRQSDASSHVTVAEEALDQTSEELGDVELAESDSYIGESASQVAVKRVGRQSEKPLSAKLKLPKQSSLTAVDAMCYQRRDKFINEFQGATHECKRIQANYGSLRRLVMILTCVVVLLVIFSVLLVFVLMFNASLGKGTGTANSYTGDRDALASSSSLQVEKALAITKAEIEEELEDVLRKVKAEIQICLSCRVLFSLLSNMGESFNDHISSETSGTCCVKDGSELIAAISRKLDAIGPRADRALDQVKLIAKSLQENRSTDELAQRLSDDAALVPVHSQGTANPGGRAAIHMIGSYFNDANSIKWMNEAAPSSVTLTSDARGVRVMSGGNYFLYVTVAFSHGESGIKRSLGNIPVSFTVLQTNLGGSFTVDIETVTHVLYNHGNGKAGCESSMQRVVQLEAGDIVKVHFDTGTTQFVSREPLAHVFGMFQI